LPRSWFIAWTFFPTKVPVGCPSGAVCVPPPLAAAGGGDDDAAGDGGDAGGSDVWDASLASAARSACDGGIAILSRLGALAAGSSPVSEGQRLDPQPASKIEPTTNTPTFLDNIIM